MLSKSQTEKIIKILEKYYKEKEPMAEQVSSRQNKLQTLISIILSARSRDSTTFRILPFLFSQIKTTKNLEKISLKKLQTIIKPINFYRNKSLYLKKLPQSLKQFNNQIPSTREELMKLPGVGRKTANLYLSLIHNQKTITVDTHVHRLSNLLSLTQTKTPLETELSLEKILPKKHWLRINYLLVLHGQNICTPISPKCSICPISKICKKTNLKKSR